MEGGAGERRVRAHRNYRYGNQLSGGDMPPPPVLRRSPQRLRHCTMNEAAVGPVPTAGSSGLTTSSSSGDSAAEEHQAAAAAVNQHRVKLAARIEELFHSGHLCDVTVTTPCGQRPVRCHRVVLSAASDYFAAMFAAGMRECAETNVVIGDVQPAALQALVRFCYTGQLELCESSVEAILSGACLLQLHDVVALCTDFLVGQLHPSNVLGMRAFADTLACGRLYQMANQYALDNFMDVCGQHEFLDLGIDALEDLIRSDDLNVPCEAAVLHAAITWLRHDSLNRADLSARLLSSVRLAFVPPDCIADCVESEPLFDSAQCQRLVVAALKVWDCPQMPERFCLAASCSMSPQRAASTPDVMRSSCSSINSVSMHVASLRPRKSTVGTMYAIGGSEVNRGVMSIEQYDCRTDTWRTVARMPTPRRLQFACAVGADRMVYMAGGRDGLKTVNSFELWRPDTNEWAAMPPMMTPRHGLGVAVLEGPLYACGGHDGWAYLSSVERFDFVSKTWSYVAEMNCSRNTAGVVALNGYIYCVGGRDSSRVLRSVERYSPHTNKWSMVAAMQRARSGVGVAVLHGCIYAVGGMDAPSSNPASERFASVERYDPRTDAWTLIADLSLGRDGVGVGALGDSLYAVGGCHNVYNCVRTVECYNVHENRWTQVSSLETGRAGSQVVVVPPRLARQRHPSMSVVCCAPRQRLQSPEVAHLEASGRQLPSPMLSSGQPPYSARCTPSPLGDYASTSGRMEVSSPRASSRSSRARMSQERQAESWLEGAAAAAVNALSVSSSGPPTRRSIGCGGSGASASARSPPLTDRHAQRQHQHQHQQQQRRHGVQRAAGRPSVQELISTANANVPPAAAAARSLRPERQAAAAAADVQRHEPPDAQRYGAHGVVSATPSHVFQPAGSTSSL